ncbi:hypothetical protein ACJIZ3_003155 [Penstemon smallii]|uniref:Uncharacterized protein n=1 Tax=Penstemon smallii TaxID=265156 RepID=A0ABD3UBV1_9LAMI
MCNRMRERDVAYRRRDPRSAANAAAQLAALRQLGQEMYYDDEEEEEEDDQTPIWTSRVMFLGSLSSIFLLILNKYFFTQTIECFMASALTLLVLRILGYIMGKVVPNRRVYFRAIRLEFLLNPGPFTMREYAMISILANLGATYGGITSCSIDWSYS